MSRRKLALSEREAEGTSPLVITVTQKGIRLSEIIIIYKKDGLINVGIFLRFVEKFAN